MWFRTDPGEIINLSAFAGIHLQQCKGSEDEYCIVAEPIIQDQESVILTPPMSAKNALMIIDNLSNRMKAIYIQDEPEIK